MRTLSIAALSALVLAGCYSSADMFLGDGSVDVSTSDGVPNIPMDCPSGTYTQTLASQVPPRVDILVVVDNSMSMAEEQDNLVKNFPYLIHSLLDPDIDPVTGLPEHVPVADLHIGVVSTDMGTGGYSVETCPDPIDGDNGELLHEPSPSMPGCDPVYPTYLSYESTEPEPDLIEWMGTAFGCIAMLGIDGCGFEQQLKAAVKALIDNRDGVNAGFLRGDTTLVVMFVTDEDDCSVAPGNEGIFDTLDSSLGHLNLRCFHHPYMIEPVETYMTAFESLRDDPGKLILSFLVGVPLDPVCEGFGDGIPACLDHHDMIEQVDPMPMTRLVPSCVSSGGEGYPARRFVMLAQQFGGQALVRSICTDDFRPAIEQLTDRVKRDFDAPPRHLESVDAGHDPEDPCRCLVECRLVEKLSSTRSCESAGKTCYEPRGSGTGCAGPIRDPDGTEHTLCEIPQAGTRMMPCDPDSPPGCEDTSISHAPDGTGWYYMGAGWTEGLGMPYAWPEIVFTEGMDLEPGSEAYLTCCY